MKNEIREARLDKLQNITNAGIDPYPAKSDRTHIIKQAVDDFEKISVSKDNITVSGRIRTIRTHGALLFMNLEDQSGQIQLFFKRDEIGKEKYDFIKNLDMGDFLQAMGTLFLTKKGEKTLNVKEYKILAKSLLPLPEKWH
ncbi:MAG: OB-fold nucleic acid binding domain-containing protein, partial [Minisyncoccia bacterium]